MQDYIVSTFPIKPYQNVNVGLMIAPVLCEIIGDILDIQKVLSFNLLHSFEEKNNQLEGYLEKINNFGIKYDHIIKDTDNTFDYLELVEQLYYLGYITITTNTVYRCECGKVEITETSIINNRVGNLYYIDSDKVYCKCCHKECKKYTEKNLSLNIKEDKLSKINIVPHFLTKDFEQLQKTFSNQQLLISKKRDTKYFLTIDNQKYNIDIDMLWMMFNQLEPANNQILIASNHQLYQMFISNYINNLLADKQITYVATPYLTNKDNLDINNILYQHPNIDYKKLAILYSLKWRNKNTNWNQALLKYLNKLSKRDLELLMTNIKNLEPTKDLRTTDYLNELFYKQINFDNDIKRLVKTK